MSTQAAIAARARIDEAISDVYVALDLLQTLPREEEVRQLHEGLAVIRRIGARFDAAAKGGVS